MTTLEAQLETLRARWEATARRDMRASGNRAAYRRAYDAYYHALGRALGYPRDHSGYYVAPDGSLPGCNAMQDSAAKRSARKDTTQEGQR